MLFSYNRTN